MGNFISSVAATIGTTATVCLMFLMPVGWAYWLWISIHIGSFVMFFLGIAGPFAIFVAPIGLWSLLFGAPVWLLSAFG